MRDNGPMASTSVEARPWVDVVIPVYNRRHTIRRAVDSVLRQTYPHVTVTVVDDGSTDGTPDVLAAYGSDIRLLRQQRRGPAAARNHGAFAGQGALIAFLDSDDEADPPWLETLVRLARAAWVAGCAGRVETPGSATETREPKPGPRGDCSPVFLAGLFAVKRTLFERVGGYDEGLRFGENSELGWRLSDAAGHSSTPFGACSTEGLVTIHQPAGRPQMLSPRALRDSAEIILGKHYDRLAAQPHHLAAYYAISGVNSLRLGDDETARTRLRSAVRRRPLAYRYWARLGQAYLPHPVRRRLRLHGLRVDASDRPSA